MAQETHARALQVSCRDRPPASCSSRAAWKVAMMSASAASGRTSPSSRRRRSRITSEVPSRATNPPSPRRSNRHRCPIRQIDNPGPPGSGQARIVSSTVPALASTPARDCAAARRASVSGSGGVGGDQSVLGPAEFTLSIAAMNARRSARSSVARRAGSHPAVSTPTRSNSSTNRSPNVRAISPSDVTRQQLRVSCSPRQQSTTPRRPRLPPRCRAPPAALRTLRTAARTRSSR